MSKTFIELLPEEEGEKQWKKNRKKISVVRSLPLFLKYFIFKYDPITHIFA